jgi:hypothetical protein
MNDEFVHWGSLVERIRTMPTTYIPATLLILVEIALKKKLLKPNEILNAVEQHIRKLEGTTDVENA